MGTITVLDQSLANKIAAGEVIERPASIVKELIDNALDAGAARILVRLKDGGNSEICVVDDGAGMEGDDLVLCTRRHATSKIRTQDDLFAIHTLGFRGEALASIAAVSTVEIRTSTGKGEGRQVVVRQGVAGKIIPAAMPRGTSVRVFDLFCNVPARKKYLRKPETEVMQATLLLTRFALIHPEKHFELKNNDRLVFICPKASDMLSNIAQIWGSRTARSLTAIHAEMAGARVGGFVSLPGSARRDKMNQCIYINRRMVRSKKLRQAVYDGYRTYLTAGTHPLFVLDISVDHGRTDVNVHPQKTYVRLEDEEGIISLIRSAVGSVMRSGKPVPAKPPAVEMDLPLSSYGMSRERQTYIAPEKKREFRVLAQALKTYAIVEFPDRLVIVDQHAAQERVRYEKYLDAYGKDSVKTQALLEPIVLELSPAQALAVRTSTDLILRLGFGIELFGKDTFLLRSCPVIFDRIQGRDIALAVIDELSGKRTLDATALEAVIRKACRKSIKAGQALLPTELAQVIEALFRSKEPLTCPHGRPTMVSFSGADLEKMFKRRN